MTGCMWPAGHSLETPALCEQINKGIVIYPYIFLGILLER